MHSIRVPSLAENVEEVAIGKWLVKKGDAVKSGEGIVELLTEKAEFTLEADGDGTVSAVLAPQKSVMSVGTILCLLDATEEEIEAAKKENERAARKHITPSTAPSGKTYSSKTAESSGNVRATPSARRLAKENNIDLAVIKDEFNIKGAIKDEHVRRYLKEYGA